MAAGEKINAAKVMNISSTGDIPDDPMGTVRTLFLLFTCYPLDVCCRSLPRSSSQPRKLRSDSREPERANTPDSTFRPRELLARASVTPNALIDCYRSACTAPQRGGNGFLVQAASRPRDGHDVLLDIGNVSHSCGSILGDYSIPVVLVLLFYY